eukprot:TRINITY_DN2920_c0_g1_i1.p1 TRINITY_DN2920_c0_g1~~TRINITY_DN2920_c0_g1_i1.p1  ORF type:complete len:392 (+),score=93.01 TRINITY_DN2920_c0_g1_i1:44-1177(+)
MHKIKKLKKKIIDSNESEPEIVEDLQSIPVDPEKAIFANSLMESARRSDPAGIIPSPLLLAVDQIRKNCITQEGLFRIPGSHSTVQTWIKLFDLGREDEIDWGYDGADACSLIINYMKSIDDSFYYTYDLVEAAIQNNSEAALQILADMPLPYRESLKLLIGLLLEIAEHKEETKLDMEKLGICFGPSYSDLIPFLGEIYDQIPNTRVYGQTHAQAVMNSNSGLMELGMLPKPIAVVIDFIERNSLGWDNVYKTNGSFSKTSEYVFKFDSGEEFEFAFEDTDCAASCLHQYFRDSADPLFGYQEDELLATDNPEKLMELVHQLPIPNRSIVIAISKHFAVVMNSQENNMDIQELADTLGPSFSTIFAKLILHSHLLY